MVVPCVHILSLSHPWLACVCIVYHYLIRGFLCVHRLSLSHSFLNEFVFRAFRYLNHCSSSVLIVGPYLFHSYPVCSYPIVLSFMVIMCVFIVVAITFMAILCLQRFVLSHSYFSRVFIIYRYLIHGYPVSS